ncbi:MAG: hypothetical protein WC804_07960 [Sphingomonas sp.]|jgi:hypothetical protein|uniref:hypothetical protein n=1 Tax=Sphingomonas sp. TaxID=28214 RepID=UPI0035647093
MQAFDLLNSQPTCLAGFVSTVDEIEPGTELPWVRRALACRHCASERFALFEIFSEEFGASGIDASCARCGEKASLFHASRDGYDGVLGHLTFLAAVGAARPLTTGKSAPLKDVLIAAETVYCINPQELAEIALEESTAVQDLFDGFHVSVRNGPNEEWRSVWNYECA